LRRIGNVGQAKYRFLSQSFMKRHGLGEYAAAYAEENVEIAGKTPRLAVGQDLEQEAEESDADWIVEALTQDSGANQRRAPIDTSMDASLGSNGLNVGVEFSFCESR
jgi:hypothetical protein